MSKTCALVRKAGVLVRFRNSYDQHKSGEWLIGLLVKYETWEKVGTVFYEGKLWSFIKYTGDSGQHPIVYLWLINIILG